MGRSIRTERTTWNLTLADHKFCVASRVLTTNKYLRSIQGDHRGLFSELHVKDAHHPVCHMHGSAPGADPAEDQGKST